MDTAFKDRINTLVNLAFQQNWEETSFSLKKAHVCAELSAIVYEDVQEHELKKNSRIHMFASETYRNIVNSGKPRNLMAFFAENKFEAKFFVVRGRYSIVLGTILGDVIILAVRGTIFRKLWDWKANLDSEKYNFSENGVYKFPFSSVTFDNQFFHKGFFESIVPQFRSINEKIKKENRYKDSTMRIVWTGHSLGGAMAAIGHAVSQSMIASEFGLDGQYKVAGAYTFGMPRYCGLGSVCRFDGPHHIYKAQDIVPTVPLRSMGFADSSREYELTDSGVVALTERTDTFGLAGHIPKLLTSIKAHSIEGYAEAIATAAGLPRP